MILDEFFFEILRNIFRNENKLVIGDLGLAKNYNEIRSSTKGAGSIFYLPPECIVGNERINTKADIW